MTSACIFFLEHTDMPVSRSFVSHSTRRQLLMAGIASLAAPFVPTRHARAAEVLRVGDMNAIGWKAFLQASGEGKDLPYEIEWSKFPAGQPEHEAFNAGALDVGQTGDTVFLFSYAAGSPARAVSAITFAPAFIQLLVQGDSGINTVAELKGRKLAVNAGGGPQLMAYGLLEQAGLTTKDVQFVFLNPLDAKPAFASRAVDAWLTWAPYSSLAIEQNDARPIADLHDTQTLYSGNNFVLIHKDSVIQKQAQISDFLARATRAQRWALNNIDAAAAALSRDTKLDVQVARSILHDFAPTPVGLTPDVRQSLQASADGFLRYGMIKQPVSNIDGAFDTRFPLLT